MRDPGACFDSCLARRCGRIGRQSTGAVAQGVSAASLVLAVLALSGCSDSQPAAYQGYAEGEFVLVASPFAGTLENINVTRGQQVARGAPLFALEQAAEQAAVREGQARMLSARARLANLQAGRRKAELDVIRAQTASADAARKLSRSQLKQQEQLHARGFISESRLDEARAGFARDSARLEETQAQMRSARQSVGRDAEIDAARTEVDAAQAALAQSEWRLEQKSAQAPAAALVHDTYFSQGEWVPAGAPIVSLLPPGNIKLRFFVPEPAAGELKTGREVSVSCDGCGSPIPAAISYIAPQPEYTPPVIYSKESRAKLVFLIEARPRAEDATRLHPGQPVDVVVLQR